MNSQAEWTYLFDRKLRIWSLLLKKTLMENFIFCAVISLFLWSLQRNYPYSSQARRNRGGWGAAALPPRFLLNSIFDELKKIVLK